MKLKCNHCSYEWEYKGLQLYYASCPRCMYKINIQKQVKGGIEKK